MAVKSSNKSSTAVAPQPMSRSSTVEGNKGRARHPHLTAMG